MSVSTLRRKHIPYPDLLEPSEDPFSTNKVTGWSLNVPIIGTCQPTTVCAETCYFAKGPSTWSSSLKKQHRLMNSMKADPIGTADRIASSARRKKMSFIRWNGGGDLFPEMIPCIDRVATELPDVPQWVVTRKAELASLITPRHNVYVHFSVDRASWERLRQMEFLAQHGLQWHWSYQCDVDETPPSQDVAPVIFRNGYDPKGEQTYPFDCPLNTSESIVRICQSCRRCFNGEAAEAAKALLKGRR